MLVYASTLKCRTVPSKYTSESWMVKYPGKFCVTRTLGPGNKSHATIRDIVNSLDKILSAPRERHQAIEIESSFEIASRERTCSCDGVFLGLVLQLLSLKASSYPLAYWPGRNFLVLSSYQNACQASVKALEDILFFLRVLSR